MRSIYFGSDHILSVTDFNQPDLHKHWAKHIAVSLDDKIEVTVGKYKIRCGGIIINSNVLHTVYSTSQRHLVFSFEEASSIAGEINRKYLRNSDFCLLSQAVVEEIRRVYNLYCLADNPADYYNVYNQILSLLGLRQSQGSIGDERILQALELIRGKKEIDKKTFRDILDRIHISQSRFSHLFKEQVGISLNSYLVMMKLKKAYEYIAGGKSFTNAALMAGFDSASHFAATSKGMIGLSAKNLSRNCRFVETPEQVEVDEKFRMR